MNRRAVKTIVIVASVVGLCGATAATAWADTFTPGIEEPTGDVGLPGGAGNDLTGSGGNHSSAAGTNGTTYGSPYDDSSSSSLDDRSDSGYWRNSGDSSGDSSDNGADNSAANGGY